MSLPLQEILGGAVMVALFVTVIAIVEIMARKGLLTPETARKSIHLSGGLGCILFPFAITSWITVLCLAIIFGGILYLGENRDMLKALSSVERKSLGSMLFPVAILALFVLSEGRLWLYVSSLLVLVLADTAAALAGVRFGNRRFETVPGEWKSLEGSVVFGVVGFLAVYLSLLMLSDMPHLTCLLTALLMSLLLSGLEAVSIGGTDNLFVPLGTCFLLLKVPTKPQVEILFQSLSLVAIAISLYLLNKHYTTLRTRSLIIFILAGFAAWSLGSAEWMIPVAVGFVVYGQICSSCEPLPSDLTARVMLRPMYPPLFILFVANATWSFDFWFAPFIVAAATTSSLCIASRYRRDCCLDRLNGIKLAAALLLPITLSLLLCLPFQGKQIWHIFHYAVPLCAITALVYTRYKRTSDSGLPWDYAITCFTAAAALLYAGIQRFGLVPPLEPSTWMEVFRCA